jgi:hypothetical protein
MKRTDENVFEKPVAGIRHPPHPVAIERVVVHRRTIFSKNDKSDLVMVAVYD